MKGSTSTPTKRVNEIKKLAVTLTECLHANTARQIPCEPTSFETSYNSTNKLHMAQWSVFGKYVCLRSLNKLYIEEFYVKVQPQLQRVNITLVPSFLHMYIHTHTHTHTHYTHTRHCSPHTPVCNEYISRGPRSHYRWATPPHSRALWHMSLRVSRCFSNV